MDKTRLKWGLIKAAISAPAEEFEDTLRCSSWADASFATNKAFLMLIACVDATHSWFIFAKDAFIVLLVLTLGKELGKNEGLVANLFEISPTAYLYVCLGWKRWAYSIEPRSSAFVNIYPQNAN